jgi:vacuolar-type H+-ATPase subunit I/STV1
VGRLPLEGPNEIRQQKIEAYKAKHNNESSGGNSSKGPGGVFSELGDKMNERGERLNQLDKKFEDMNTASGDFLKAVKEYNERQARKKWWEF